MLKAFLWLPKDLFDFHLAALSYISRRIWPAASKKMPAGLTPIEDVSRLSERVTRVLGQNPGPFTLQGTNTYLVGTGRSKILIDTGEPDIAEYLANLLRTLGEQGGHIVAIVVTHWHRDHVGGVGQIRAHFAERKQEPIPVYKFRRTDGQPEPADGDPFQFVEDGHQLSVEGATLSLLYTPGHTADHMAVWLEEEQALFSGDCVLGEGSSIFEDLATYMASLAKLKALKPRRIYPGHGPVIEQPAERIDQYIAHRLEREREILEMIRREEMVSTMRITSTLYPNILPDRRLAALLNVQHHLAKLVAEGKVVNVGFGFGLYKIAVDGEESRNQSRL